MKTIIFLSANTYNPYSGEEITTHKEPKEILREISETSNETHKILDKIKHYVH